MQFIIYDNTTGTITQWGTYDTPADLTNTTTPSNLTILPIPDISGDPGPFLMQNYVDLTSASVAPRQAMPVTLDQTQIAADGVAEATISGVPACQVSITGPLKAPLTAVSDGSIVFTTNVPGSYTITASSAPYLIYGATINAI
jgi:hypothetical protein